MLRKIDARKMGQSNQGWLKSHFHFSFADYYNPTNIRFGVLRVINDDLIDGGTGFDLHPHRDMEIISYVVDGALTHGDNMGNSKTITRGHVQYMSAGTGVMHSEHNPGKDVARLLQIWIYPDQKNLKPQYGDLRFEWEARKNTWLHVVSSQDGLAPIKIHQDANIHVTSLEKGMSLDFEIKTDRQAYLVQIEGTSIINGVELNQRDGLEIIGENIHINSIDDSHILLIEMQKGA